MSESPYEEGGKYAGTFAFITDLTDLRQAEAKVLQKNMDLERALERITALNQAASGALHGGQRHSSTRDDFARLDRAL